MNTPDRHPTPPAERAVPPPPEPAPPGEAETGLQAMVDAESEQSFPASDPPSWTLGLH